MKFINKSILTILAALASAGQAVAYPYEVTKLTKGEGKDQITIWNFKDMHFEKTSDKSNADRVVSMAKKLNATLIVENSLDDNDGNNTSINNYSEKKWEDNFLWRTYRQAKNKNIDVRNAETRQAIIMPTFVGQWESSANMIYKALNSIRTNLQKKINLENKPAFKAFYAEILKNISDFSEYKNENTDVNVTSSIKETAQFTDIKILIEISNGLSKNQKNFIICAGGHHGDVIDNFLTTQEFKKEILFNGFPEEFQKKMRENTNPKIEDVVSELYPEKLSDDTWCSPMVQLMHKTKEINWPEITDLQTSLFTPKRLLIATGIIATTTIAAVLYGPSLWRWLKTKFA